MALRISSTLPQSSVIRLQRANLPKFGSTGADAYEITGRTQVKCKKGPHFSFLVRDLPTDRTFDPSFRDILRDSMCPGVDFKITNAPF